jgi:pilus assembly protein CpaC
VIASRNIVFLSLALAFAALTAPALARPALDESSARALNISTRSSGGAHQRITLSLDKAAVVQLDSDARDVLVSNPEMVDAVVRTPRRIFLLATKVGQTNAFFFDGEGKQILALDIRVEKDVVDLASLMRASLPNSSVVVQSMNDNVVLTGTVSSALESTRAADLAARFAGDPKKVVNMLSVAGGAQVMLKVRIAEMNRNIAKQFGIDLQAAAKVGGVPLSGGTSNPFGLLGRALSDMSGGQAGSVCSVALSAGGPCSGGPNNAQGVLKALEQVGLVHMLAEPNLTAVSGETARFLAGGEFPVPAGRDQQGNVSIQFKQFGVGLSFTPVVLSPGQRADQHRLLRPGGRQRQRPDHPGLVGAPHPDHGGTALGRQLRGGGPHAAQYQAGD